MKNNNKVPRTTYRVSRTIASFAIIALFFLSGCAEREITNRNSQGKSIICFGDSVTFGYGVDKGNDYPSHLSEKLKLPVINAGVDGDTSAKALERLKTDVLEKNPYLVIIEFGGNDFMENIPVSQTIQNMDAMIRQIHAQGAMVAVVDISTQLVMTDLGKELRKLSDAHKTIFVPQVLNNILTNPSRKSDFIHPNAEGYKIIACRVQEVIVPYLPQQQTAAPVQPPPPEEKTPSVPLAEGAPPTDAPSAE